MGNVSLRTAATTTLLVINKTIATGNKTAYIQRVFFVEGGFEDVTIEIRLLPVKGQNCAPTG